ncbi:MAG: hypothetical protein ACLQJL_06065 [Roseiarcus sp.]
MSTDTWKGGAGDWTTPADWQGGVPGSGDTADINSGDATISSTDAGITVASIDVGAASATLTIADPGQTQTVTGAFSNSGTLDVDGAGAGGSTLDIEGTLTNSAAGPEGVFIGNAAITQATAVSVGGLSNTGDITLAGGSAAATATLTLTGSGTDTTTITMNSFADLAVTGALTLQGGTIDGGTLSGGGAIENAVGYGETFNGVAIANGTTVTDNNSSDATLIGTIANNGEISVHSTGGGSTLYIGGSGATLSGGGTVALSTGIDNLIIGASGSSQLVNASNTIEGSGEITGLHLLDNQSGATIDADQSAAQLLIYGQASGTLTNEGAFEATNGGTLNLESSVLIQNQGGASGNVEANGLGSIVELLGGTIVGGTLTTSGGGMIETVSSATLNGVTISGGSTYTASNGSTTTLLGTIVNDGEISVDSTGGVADLDIAASGATLTAGGTVVLSNNANNSITGASGAHLVNVNNTIEGSGEISGLGGLDNQSGATIDADQSAQLLIYEQASGTLTNEGVYEATGVGTLNLEASTLIQNQGGAVGDVEAVGPEATVDLSGATIVGGALTASGGGVIQNVAGNITTLSGVTISNGTTYTDDNNSALALSGTIVNDGEISVDAVSGTSELYASASGATLTGGGMVVLSDSADNGITGATSASQLINANNTIEGSGEISGLHLLDNQLGATVDANQSTTLLIYEQAAGTLTNEGTFEATGGGTLDLDFATLIQNQNGANGFVEANGAGSIVELSAGTIVGGTLSTSNGGVIESYLGNGGTLNDVTLSTGANYDVTDGSQLTLVGTIVNDGEISLQAATSTSTLEVSGVVTLTGDGTVALSNNVDNGVTETGGGSQLVNASNTIQGSGQIDGLSALDNQAGGTIDADQSKQLQIFSIGTLNTLTNDGIFEATNGGTLDVTSAITGSGELLVQASSEIELGGATSETTTFLGADGTLKLVTPSNYSGTISGFAVGDTLDLGITNVTTATPTADGANTTLTVDLSGGTPLTYTLAGDYTGDTFTVTHSGADSLITVSAANAPPTLGGAGDTVGYIQAGAAVAIDGGLTVSDAADPIITDATVQIGAGFVAGDQLSFTDQNGISGSYNPTSGILTLTGTEGVTAYQDALESVTFSSTSSDPTNGGADPTRTVTWIVGNGAANSTPVTSTIDVTALPVLVAGATATYTQDGSAVAVDGGLTVADVSSATLDGASVTIGGGLLAGDLLNFTGQSGITGSYDATTGTLSLAGAANLAAYQAALDSVTFSSTSSDPANGGDDATRTIDWTVSSGAATSTPATSTINVVDLPTISSAAFAATFDFGESAVAVDPDVTVADPSSAALSSATISITSGFQSGDALNFANQGAISGSYNASSGVLTLTGSASLEVYQAALESVTFSSSSTSATARSVSWQVSDANGNSSNVATSTVGIADVPPVLGGAGDTVGYTQGGAATVIDSGLTAADPSSATLSGATVSVTGGFFAGDTLTIDGATSGAIIDGGGTIDYAFSGSTLTLSGVDTLADYQTALDSVAFSSTSLNPTDFGADLTRTISWQATSGALTSTAVTSTVDVAGVDQPPVLSNGGNTATYTIGGAAQAVDAGLAVSDPDSLDLAGATVAISGGLQTGDTLNFTTQNGIAGSYNAISGVLTLTGSATVAAYQAALESVTFSTSSASASARTISWQVTDGTLTSNTISSAVDIVYLPPTLGGAGDTVTYTSGGSNVAIDPALTVADQSSGTLTGATVSISSGFKAGDTLNFTNQNGITGSYNATSGVLTLTGAASLAAYQAALESVTFSSTAANASASSRQISWQVSDQVSGGPDETSSVATSTVNIPAPVTTVASWSNNKGGNWNTASNWTPAAAPGATSEANIEVSGAYTITSTQNNSVGSLNIADPNATLAIANESTFTLGAQAPSGNDGTIVIGAGSTLDVTGTIANPHTIETFPGVAAPATLENGAVDNGALVTASTGTTLLLKNTTIDNLFPTPLYPTGGELQAATLSTIELDNATIAGGTLLTASVNSFFGRVPTALINTVAGSQSNVLNGAVAPVTDDAYLRVSNDSSLTLMGTVVDNFNIALDSTGQATNLQISGSVALTGDGQVDLGSPLGPTSNENSIVGVGSSAALTTGADISIYGSGAIGGPQMTFDNKGSIYAENGTLTINTGSNALTNSGEMWAGLGGTGSLVVESPVIGAGSENILLASTLEFGSSVSSGQTVYFDDGGFGAALKLDHAESFNGTIAGFAADNRTTFDTVDLADFRFADTKITAISGTGRVGSDTNVTLTDSLDHLTTTLHLLNNLANQFGASASDYTLLADSGSPLAGTLFSVDHTAGTPNR